MSMGHTQKKDFIDKEMHQKSSYGGDDVPSKTYPPSLPHP